MSSSPNTTQKILIRCGRHGWAVATLTLRPGSNLNSKSNSQPNPNPNSTPKSETENQG